MKILKKYLNKSFWRNKTVLITGINGFVGGNLARQLIINGANIIGITNSLKKNKFLKYSNLLPYIQFHNTNIKNYNDISKILNNNKIDICFHLAAQVDVNVAKVNPYLTFESNIKGTYNILECLRQHKNIKSIIVASSDKAYGEYKSVDLPYTENHDLRPLYPYDVSKASADLIAKSYASELFNMPIVVTRFANIYGPGQLNFTALIPDCILSVLGYRDFIPRSNGKNKRDFLFINDVCELYMCLAYNLYLNPKYKGEIYNAGTSHGYTVKEIIKTICKLSKRNDLYRTISSDMKNKQTSGEICHQFMTYNKLKKVFGWKPQYCLEDGLNETISWYKEFLKKNSYKYFIDK
tara:strand:+ start:381 stop:1433 length:1053 start_codon:yes stop_codon:yes gene_type:complete